MKPNAIDQIVEDLAQLPEGDALQVIDDAMSEMTKLEATALVLELEADELEVTP